MLIAAQRHESILVQHSFSRSKHLVIAHGEPLTFFLVVLSDLLIIWERQHSGPKGRKVRHHRSFAF